MSEPREFSDVKFLHLLFDAIPAMLVVADEDVRIHHLNASASVGLGIDLAQVRGKRGGDTLHCIHAQEVPRGCGHAIACQDCVIRNGIQRALAGERTFRKGTRMVLINGTKETEIHLLISASPIHWERKDYVLLTLENVSELVQLRNLLPLCMHCMKIRDDDGYWNEITTYIHNQLDVEFSHGLCRECLEKFYPKS